MQGLASVANRDEALRAFELGSIAFGSGEFATAQKFFRQSLRLWECDESRDMLSRTENIIRDLEHQKEQAKQEQLKREREQKEREREQERRNQEEKQKAETNKENEESHHAEHDSTAGTGNVEGDRSSFLLVHPSLSSDC